MRIKLYEFDLSVKEANADKLAIIEDKQKILQNHSNVIYEKIDSSMNKEFRTVLNDYLDDFELKKTELSFKLTFEPNLYDSKLYIYLDVDKEIKGFM